MSALHTTHLNHCMVFNALRVCRGVYRKISESDEWDERLLFLTPIAAQSFKASGAAALQNRWHKVAPEVLATYREEDRDPVTCIDALSVG